MKHIRRWMGILLVTLIVTTSVMSVPLFAAPQGSVMLTPLCMNPGHGVVYGSSFSVYQMATIDVNGEMTPVQALEDTSVNIQQWQTKKEAEKMAQVVKQQQLASWADADAGKNGSVYFAGLDSGVYLVVQTNTITGYNQALPFAVAIPMKNPETGKLEYEIAAQPKITLASDGDPNKPGGDVQKPPVAMPQTPPTATPQKPSIGDLFQTGQLHWPIPFLVIGGIAAIIIGWRILRSERKR